MDCGWGQFFCNKNWTYAYGCNSGTYKPQNPDDDQAYQLVPDFGKISSFSPCINYLYTDSTYAIKRNNGDHDFDTHMKGAQNMTITALTSSSTTIGSRVNFFCRSKIQDEGNLFCIPKKDAPLFRGSPGGRWSV